MSDSDELIELTIGAPAHGGACVARDDSGRVVFVRFALPGEKVRARVIDSHKRMLWAEAVEDPEQAGGLGAQPPRALRDPPAA